MNGIIISIHPKYVEQILSEEKKYEYRTRICSKNINKIYIYETSPKMMIVAEVEIVQVLKDTPKNIWNKTHKAGGINLEDFNKYFKNKEYAYAYELGEITKYDKPKSLSDFGIKSPPQSFVYV